jgi:hypothetical protein
MAEPNLRRGQGPRDWVLHAQKQLNYALSGGMHIDVPENGVFDEAFEQEVEGFQGRSGIEQDGKIGPDTWAALKAAVEAKQNASDADEDPDFDAPRQAQERPGQHREDNVFRERKDKDGSTVRVYDMEGENVVSGSEWNSVVTSMVEMSERRNRDQIPYVILGVKQFADESGQKISQFAHAAQALHEASHIDFPWDLLIDGLDTALSTVFTVSGVGGWIYGHVKSALLGNIVDELTSRTSPVPGLEAKLRTGIAELAQEMTNRQQRAIDTVQQDIHDYIETQMLEYTGAGQFTNDAKWIDEMVTYFGFPDRGYDDVAQPILSWLNHQFDAMLEQTNEELLKTV